MCDKQDKIDKLERELFASHEREARLFDTLASARNHESQIVWRPWQVALIPTFISIVALIAAIAS